MHTNKISVAILVDGKSLYESKNNEVFLPFGTTYEVFIKNQNSFDIYVNFNIDNKHLYGKKYHKIEANSSKTIKTFSFNDTNYSFKFIEKNEQMQKLSKTSSFDGNLVVNVFKLRDLLKELEESNPFKHLTKPLTRPTVLFNKTLLNEDSEQYISTGSSLRSSFSSELSSKEKVSLNSPVGNTTFGEPLKESVFTPSEHSLKQETFFTFKLCGVSDKKEPIVEPLFAKNNLRCLVCDSKIKTEQKYCSCCGSYIVLTNFLIDSNKTSLKKCSCSKKEFPTDYKNCPYCTKLLV